MWRGKSQRRARCAIASLLLVVLGAGRARAQDVVALRPPGLAEDAARSRVADEGRSGGRSEWRGERPLEHRSILLDLGSLRLSDESAGASLLNEIAPETEAPGSVVRAYHGIQAILVRRALGYYHELLSEDTRTLWDRSQLGISAFQDRCWGVAALEGDLNAGGRWWERTWRQSLLPEKGGARSGTRVEEVGREIELVRLGEVALTTEGKVRVGRLSVYVDDDRVYERVRSPLESLATPQSRARSDAHLARSPGASPSAGDPSGKDRPRLPADDGHVDLGIGLEDDADVELEQALRGSLRARVLARIAGPSRGTTPRGNLWTGDGWNVSVRPTLQLRIPQLSALEGTVGQAAVQVDVGLYPNDLREPWAIVTLRVKGNPRAREVVASLDFEVVRW